MGVYERVVSWAGVCVLVAGVLATEPGSPAQAQPQPSSLTGAWRAGSTQIDVAIESWGEDCGPRPQSSRSAGGGVVNVEQSAGQLVIHGRGQDIRSDTCWSRNPSMRRQSADFANSVWTTKCRTPANDPREEQGTYTLRVESPDMLTYRDVSRYNWALNQSRCVATFTTLQTLTRRAVREPAAADKPAKSADPAPETASGPKPAPPEPDDKVRDGPCVPADPHRLVIRPRRVEIEVGERICFRARLVDRADCPIKDPNLQWSLAHSKALRGTLNNACFTAADTAAEAEGEFKITAALGGLRSEATVSVHPVDLSALIAKRMGTGGALTGFDEAAPLPATPRSVTRVTTRNEPLPSTTSPRKLFGIALALAALLLAVAALYLTRRSGQQPRSELASIPSPLPTPAPARLEVAHANTPAVRQPELKRTAAQAEAWICPECRVGYPAEQHTCPKDGTALMPYSQFAQQRRKTEEERTKRCPRCGQMYPAHASFCAEDGTPLLDG